MAAWWRSIRRRSAPSSGCSELVKQRLGGKQIARVQSLRKPAVDLAEQLSRLLRFSLGSPQSGDAHRCAKLQRFLRSAAREIERGAQALLGAVGSPKQQLTFDPVNLGGEERRAVRCGDARKRLQALFRMTGI